MKRIISVCLVAVMLMALLFAGSCFKKGDEISKFIDGKYVPPIEITYCYPLCNLDPAAVEAKGWTVSDTPWTKAALDRMGIELKLEWSNTDLPSYVERLNAAVFTGDVPDFINLTPLKEYSSVYLKALNDNDILADLTDLFDTYASADTKRVMELAGPEVFYPATFDGRIKGLPSFLSSADIDKGYWMRKDWLDTLGMDVPTNFDEFKEVLIAFTKNDPDGNGLDDTTGFNFYMRKDIYPKPLFNGFGSYPYDWIELEDGTIGYGSIQNETKEALAYLRELYSLGCLTFPEDFSTCVINGKCGSLVQVFSYALLLQTTYDKNENADFIPFYGFTKDGGKMKYIAEPPYYRYYAMNKDCDYPEVVILLMNLYLQISKEAETDQQMFNNFLYSEDGAHHYYHIAPVIASSPPDENIPEEERTVFARVSKALELGSTEPLKTSTDKDVYRWVTEFRNGNKSFWGWEKLYGENGAFALPGQFRKDGNEIIISKFNAAPTDSMNLYLSTLEELENQMYIDIITSKKPLDYFEAFVKQWKESGGDDITKEVNDWYKSVAKLN